MKPIHKNVWLWAFLVGVFTVTLMRPLLRRIPEAPPVLGRLPSFVLVDPGGGRFDLTSLEGSVWIVAFFSTSDDSICGGLIESMTELGQRYDDAGVAGVRLLGIGTGRSTAVPEEAPALAAARWSLATGEADEISGLAGALVTATGKGTGSSEVRSGIPRPCRLYLVDGAGGIRGAYRDDTRGLDEVFHRAQHVARATGL